MEYDLVIENGNVIQFEPDRIERNNIGIKDGKIKIITDITITGKRVINAKDLYVSPGFIDFHSHVNGRLFSAQCMLRQGVTTTIGGERNFESNIIRDIEENGFIINHGFYISYSFTLRKAVGLHDPSQRATQKEISEMINLAERFFEFGVLGIHIGLEYAPGTSEEELTSLLKIAKKHNRTAMIHLRNDGYRALESIDEIIRATKESGASVNILHTMYTAGLPNVMAEFLLRIEKARKNGCDLTADTGVYASYPTFAGSLSLQENWQKDYGDDISEANLMISSGIRVGQFCTKDTFQYIRKEFPTTLITAFVYDENQIAKAIKPEYMMISTNGAYGPHHENIGHPEGSGTYPKLIGKYVRDKKTIDLVEAIKKISWHPTNRIGIKNKGILKENYDADITIFDLDTIDSQSDYVGFGDPNLPPLGISTVMVNGITIIQDSKLNDKNTLSGCLVRWED